jgi:hypothetical protein
MIKLHLPGAMRTIHVVISCHSGDDREILSISQAHLLCIELLQAISVLGFGRPSIRLFQPWVRRIQLLVLVVDASSGGIEVTSSTLEGG